MYIFKKHKEHYIFNIFGLKIKVKRKIPKELQVHLWANFEAAYKNAVKDGFVKNKKEHKKNIENLRKNLSSSAKKHIDEILKKFDKILPETWYFPDEIYNKKELKVFLRVKEELSKIQKFEDYYQYKDYKLPINSFEPAIFIDKHGLDRVGEIGDGVIIDAGGYICDSALVLREKYPENEIISFEPVSKLADYCHKTIELNNLQNIKVEKYALGNNVRKSKIKLLDNLLCCRIDNELGGGVMKILT